MWAVWFLNEMLNQLPSLSRWNTDSNCPSIKEVHNGSTQGVFTAKDHCHSCSDVFSLGRLCFLRQIKTSLWTKGWSSDDYLAYNLFIYSLLNPIIEDTCIVTVQWTSSFFKSWLLFRHLHRHPHGRISAPKSWKGLSVPLTERTTDAARCLLEAKPLITAVLLMNGTYSARQATGKI